MGEELPLARTAKERWTMLLVKAGVRESIEESTSRDTRKKESATTQVSLGAAVKDIEAKSKVSRRAKGPYASSTKSKGHRQDNKNRKSYRGDEGEDSKPRRSASELGITWLDSVCVDGKAHYLIEFDMVDGGSIFRCRYCRKIRLLPLDPTGIARLDTLMKKFGRQNGYCQYLNYHRAAKIMVAKLQELERLSLIVNDKLELARIADKILREKDYDSIFTTHTII